MKYFSLVALAILLSIKSFGCIPPIAPIQGFFGTICMGSPITLTDDTTGGVWRSYDTTIATINAATGLVTPMAVGSDTIYYTITTSCGSNTLSLVVNVSALAMPVFYSSLSVGSYCTFSLPSGATMSGVTGSATWPSGTDTFYATSAGTVALTVTSALGCAFHDTLTVGNYPVVGAITLGSTLHGCSGNTGTVTDTSTGGTWSSSNPAVATVNPTTGMVNENATGTALISYTVTGSGGAGWRCILVKVDQVPAAIAGRHSVCRGDTIMLSTNNYWSVFSSTILGVTWASSDTTKATVTSATTPSVTLTGTGWGTVTLTATSLNSGCSTSTTITIDTLPVLAAITGTTTMCSSLSTTLHESYTGTGGAWSSANTTIATVNSSGTVFGMYAGTATISYTVRNSCGSTAVTASVTVNALPTVAAITGTNLVNIGGTTALANATTGGTWSSNAPSVATINTTGVVTGVSLGTAVITYSVTNGSGCVNFNTMTVSVAPPAGMADLSNDNIQIFPNPAHGNINISWKGNQSADVRLLMIDITGRRVISRTLEMPSGTGNSSIDVSNLNAGIYFVTLQGSGVNYVGKVVIE